MCQTLNVLIQSLPLLPTDSEAVQLSAFVKPPEGIPEDPVAATLRAHKLVWLSWEGFSIEIKRLRLSLPSEDTLSTHAHR